MPEIRQVAGAVSTVAVCAALVTSGLMSMTQSDRIRGHMAAYIIQKWYRDLKKKKAFEKQELGNTEETHPAKYQQLNDLKQDFEDGSKDDAGECRPRRKKLLMTFQPSYTEPLQQYQEVETKEPEVKKHRFSDAFRSKRLSLTSYSPRNWRERKRQEMCPSCSRQSTKERIAITAEEAADTSKSVTINFPSWFDRRSAALCPICCWKRKTVRKKIVTRRVQSHASSIFSIILSPPPTGKLSEPSARTFRKCLGLVSEDVKREHAARIIQRWYRCIKKGWLLSTVSGLNTPRKQRQEVIRDLMRHAASVLIQRWFRHHRKRRYALHYVHMYASAYYIQMWLEQQHLRWHMLHYVHVCAAAVAIQKWYHRMKRVRCMMHYVYLCEKANLIKRWYRTQRVRRNIEIYAKRKAAVLKIENWWIRRHKVAILEAYVVLTKIAIKIQRYCRQYLKSKFLLKYARTYQASIVLKRGMKGILRLRSIDNYLHFSDNASLIQRWYKRMKKRKYILHYLHLYAAALVIQQWYRKSMKIGYMLHYIHLDSAATALQRWYLVHLVSMKMMHHAHALAAVNAIQQWYAMSMKRRYLRKYLAANPRSVILKRYKEYWKSSAVNYLQRRYKSRILQKWYRDKNKRRFILDYIKMDGAAIKIQRWYRNEMNRKRILNYLEYHCAACKVKRHYIARQKWIDAVNTVIKNIKGERKKVRKQYIIKKVRRSLRQRYVEANMAALVIQKAYRAWIGLKKALSAVSRSLHNWYYSVDEEAMARAYHEERIRNLRMRKICDACATKKLFRVGSKVRIASNIFVNENSIVIIQRWWRKVRLANLILDRAQMMTVELQVSRRQETA